MWSTLFIKYETLELSSSVCFISKTVHYAQLYRILTSEQANLDDSLLKLQLNSLLYTVDSLK